jgi:saccharopine dehydrogenase-like NADP-dependent oxidoreductase
MKPRMGHKMTTKRLLLIGGTGVFGQRLAANLARIDGLELILTSRSASKAQALAAGLSSSGAVAGISGMALDHRQELDGALSRVAPWLVIDASGPFQGAGYKIPKAALNAGAHVIDLADARDYLRGYRGALDESASKNRVAGLAGASSTPALSAAVVRQLTSGWRRVDTIDIAITPAGRSAVGRSVIDAILSYAGRPVPVWRDGRLEKAFGWCDGRSIHMPALGKRRVAPVETVDAELLGPRYQVAERVTFYAGLESTIEQRGLELLARLRRIGLLGDLKPLAKPLLLMRKLTRLPTTERGGMLVEINGLDADGRLCRSRWSLLAEEDDGPHVPTLPAVAAVRALLSNKMKPGAHLAAECLSLADIEAEMVPHAITTSCDERRVQRPIPGDRFGLSLPVPKMPPDSRPVLDKRHTSGIVSNE